jgi:glycosyltransferase involved in cell wall biosynthesis
MTASLASAGSVSIILPVHNQADHLDAVIGEFEDALARLAINHELIIVVNSSSDGSLGIAERLADRYKTVRVLSTDVARWGHAVRLGLRAATGDLICYTNSARTSASDLALVLMYALAYPDVVIKVNRRVRESARRRLGSLLFNLECRMMFELSCWDINGTPKVFPRRFAPLLSLTRNDDLIDLEFNIVCRDEAYRMLEVPVLSTRRRSGQSTTNLRSAARLYWGAFRIWRARRNGQS